MTGPLLPHERKRGLGDVDHAEEIRLNLRTKLVEACVFDRTDVAIPGIVDEHVEPSKCLGRYGDGMDGLLLVGHIQRNGSHLVAIPLDQIGELRWMTRRCNELVASSEYCIGECAPKAPRAPGNQPDL